MKRRDDAAELRGHLEIVDDKLAIIRTYVKVISGVMQATGRGAAVDVMAARGHISSAIGHLEGMLEILKGKDAESGRPL